MVKAVPQTGHDEELAGIQASHSEQRARSVSNSMPHLGQLVDVAGMKAPHSPHSTTSP